MTIKARIAISSLSVELPIVHGKPVPHTGTDPALPLRLELHASGCQIWCGGCISGESYEFRPETESAHLRRLGIAGVEDMPHLDAVFRHLTDQAIAHRSDQVGAFLQPAVQAMERAIATRDGSSVYFAQAGDQVKIGWSKRVAARLAQLQTGNPFPVSLLGTTPGGRGLERQLHERFAHLRTIGEWFRIDDELRAYIAGVRP